MQLSDIRTEVFSLLRETEETDTNFTATQINAFINQAVKLLVPIIEQPRKFSSGTQVTQGTGSYVVPSDFVMLKTVYFGDESVNGDSSPLQFVTEQFLRAAFPSWRSTSSQTQDRPRYIMLLDDDTFYIYPTPSAAEAVSGKKLIYNYLFLPTDLSSDSDTPDLPLPYHDLIKFYAAYLCYLNLGNKDTAVLMYKSFMEQHKLVQSASTIESEENLAFSWVGDVQDLDEDGPRIVIP